MKIDSGYSNGAWWQVGSGKMMEECRGVSNCSTDSRGIVVEVTMVVVKMTVDR